MIEGKTSITIPVALENVERLRPGETWSTMADGGCEVYVVRPSSGGTVIVDVFAIIADQVTVSAENIP